MYYPSSRHHRNSHTGVTGYSHTIQHYLYQLLGASLMSTHTIFALSQVTSGAFFRLPVPVWLSLKATSDSVNCHTCSSNHGKDNGMSIISQRCYSAVLCPSPQLNNKHRVCQGSAFWCLSMAVWLRSNKLHHQYDQQEGSCSTCPTKSMPLFLASTFTQYSPQRT